MGAAVSTNFTKSVNESINSVIQENISTCAGSAVNEVNIKATKDVNISGGSIDQKATINLKCVSSQMTSNDFSATIGNRLAQEATSKLDGFNFGIAASTNAVDTANKIVNEINVKNIQNQIANAANKVNIEAGGDVNIKDLPITQFSSTIVDVVSRAVSNSKTVTDIQQSIDQKATATTIGIFGGSAAIIVILLIVVFFAMSGGGGGGDGDDNEKSDFFSSGVPFIFRPVKFSISDFAVPDENGKYRSMIIYAIVITVLILIMFHINKTS